MQQQRQVVIYITTSLIIYLITLVTAIAINPSLFSNLIGFVALVLYALTLVPSIAKLISPKFGRKKAVVFLLKHRRFIGVFSFCLGLNHGILQIIKRELNLLDPSVYYEYRQGFSLIAILAILSLTSSHEAVKYLKKKWQRLHLLTYLIPFVGIWHITDKMAGHWSYLTPTSIILSSVLAVFCIWRQYRYYSTPKPAMKTPVGASKK